MKITETDLDQQLRDKITALDGVKTLGKTGYIKYDGKQFQSDDINRLKLSEVFSEDQIREMLDHEVQSGDNIITGFDTPIALTKQATGNGDLMGTLVGAQICQTAGKILMFRIYGQFYLFLDSTGVITKLSKADVSQKQQINALDIIHANFVYNNFDVYSITSIDYWDGNAIVATEHDGIYCMSFTTREYSQKIKEPNVSAISVLGDNKTLAVSKTGVGGNVVFYDLRDGTKTAIFGNLGNKYQTSDGFQTDGGKYVFTLGKPVGISFPDKILHAWKLDDAGIDFGNIDFMIAKNKTDPNSHVKFMRCCDDQILVAGENGKRLFVWCYSKKSLNTTPDEIVFSKFDVQYEDIKDISYQAGQYSVIIGDRLLKLGPSFETLQNYALQGLSKNGSAYFDKDRIVGLNDREIILYIPEQRRYQQTLKFEIYNSDTSCNNIDVIVNAGNKYQMAFIDGNTGTTIVPYFYMKLDKVYHVIKLMGQEYKKIYMLASLDDGDVINSIIIHKNRIFYK